MITPSIEHKETTFRGVGGVDLFVQTWEPVGAIRGVVAVVHGISEHSGRYGYLVERLTKHGFAVAAFDNRGHGRSRGVHGHIDSWADYREDVRAFIRYVSAHFMRIPLFLYGHSLGALIVSDYVLFYPQGLDGVILSGHPLQPTGAAKPYLVLIARILSRYKPLMALPLGVADDALSRDPAVVKAFGSDPLVHRKVTARWGVETLGAIDRVRARAGEIQLPLLVLHGGADRVNSAKGSEELFKLVSSTDKQLRIYPGGFHEPHNDLDRETVMSDVIGWLDERAASIPDQIDS